MLRQDGVYLALLRLFVLAGAVLFTRRLSEATAWSSSSQVELSMEVMESASPR